MAVLNTQRIVSASADGTLKVWNLQTGRIEKILRGHTEAVRTVAKLDAQRIISGSADNTVKVWNLQTGSVEQTLSDHTDSVTAVAVLDAQHIVSGSHDHTVKVWNLQTRKAIASIGLDGAPQCLAVVRQRSHTLVVAGDAVGAIYCLELMNP